MALINRKNERGSLMVEAIAVVALLGLMGTVLYRQVRQRNDELDNINMASEIRVVKEATMAYIQSFKSELESESGVQPGGCIDGTEGSCYGYVSHNTDMLHDIEGYMPDNWTDLDHGGGVINSYKIGVVCYVVTPGETRTACYGIIAPNAVNDGNGSPMPIDFTLRRAARVANLIGADGGVFSGSDDKLHGTQGTWELSCPDDLCEGRHDPFYVATTGVDVYIPEVDGPENTVSIPDSLALNRLHSTDYFSVGAPGVSCVTNMVGGDFAHENVNGAAAADDTIANVGTAGCDPLFWVGTNSGTADDKSKAGSVYVKNNLYIGRDNTSDTHAVSIEAGSGNANRKLEVYSADGDARLTLNAEGQVIGRNEGGKGYKLDAATGAIILFEEKTVDGNVIEVPTLRLRGTRLESNTVGQYQASPGAEPTSEVYNLNPEGTSFVNDIRLAARGGAKLSEILPRYIAMNIVPVVSGKNGNTEETVKKPSCPAGYVRAITVTPTVSNPRVTEVQLHAHIPGTPAGAAVPERDPDFVFQRNDDASGGIDVQWSPEQNADDGSMSARLVMLQPGYVRISIDDLDDDNWKVDMTYQGDINNAIRNSSEKKYIHGLAHTYCVYDENNFAAAGGAIAKDSTNVASGFYASASTKAKTTIPTEVDSTISCTGHEDCLNTEQCTSGKCQVLTSCSGVSNCHQDGGRYFVVDCVKDETCGTGKVCYNNRCKKAEGTPGP